MLRNGTDLVAALSVLERQDFGAPVRAMTSELIEQASADISVEELIAARADVFPPVCIFALQAGEAARQIPETLLSLADCLAQAAELGLTLTAEPGDSSHDGVASSAVSRAPAVRVVDSMLGQAVKAGAHEVHVHASDDGTETWVAFEVDESEPEVVKLPIDVLGPICRRICVMAQINWWSKEPTLGTLTIRHRGADVVGSVRFIPGEREEHQQVYVTFRELP
jgi:type II secretory ATPase GspE/PulE/Tfp pilus assembly ATPase PilB-like protein